MCMGRKEGIRTGDMYLQGEYQHPFRSFGDGRAFHFRNSYVTAIPTPKPPCGSSRSKCSRSCSYLDPEVGTGASRKVWL
jgi:hypothetical protein